jgi:hypothetical protein
LNEEGFEECREGGKKGKWWMKREEKKLKWRWSISEGSEKQREWVKKKKFM